MKVGEKDKRTRRRVKNAMASKGKSRGSGQRREHKTHRGCHRAAHDCQHTKTRNETPSWEKDKSTETYAKPIFNVNGWIHFLFEHLTTTNIGCLSHGVKRFSVVQTSDWTVVVPVVFPVFSLDMLWIFVVGIAGLFVFYSYF